LTSLNFQECIDQLSDVLDFSEYASLIIHPLVRCLDSGVTELRPHAMETLTALVVSQIHPILKVTNI
jgi:FKBP12-rapamycin complex-associated protein